MSEPPDERAEAGESGVAPPEPPAASRAPAPPSPASGGGLGWGQVAIALAGVLLLVIALVATGPFWAPLLPWGEAAARDDAALAAGIDRLEAAQRQNQQEQAVTTAALQRLDQRLGAIEARPAAPASEIAGLRQQAARLAETTADLTARIDAIDKAVHRRTAGDPTDIALVLALLQIRDAIEAGRPFAAAYEALVALAAARPEIAAAAAPLAGPATTGLAGRPVLANRLRELAGAIAAADASANAPANTKAAAPGWADQALARLRGVVTIRRVDGAGPGPPGAGPSTAVNAALLALAGGDLEGAVSALDALTGAPAEAAHPWLRMAKERLAAEAALQRIEALLAARLGTAANAPAGAGSPR